MKNILAINGGKKTRIKPFPAQPGPDGDYIGNVEAVLKSRILSGYRGNGTPAFWGGQFVQRFERDIEIRFEAQHAIACNSATAGLWMACQALGIKPGDEVIVTPWSMSCSATVPLLFGAIPVFADIDSETYCLDPESVRERITDRTRAIIAVDLFGQCYDPEINAIAQEHGIAVIEDAAQAIGAQTASGTYAGLQGDIGVYSFTQGKHLTAGEGGCCVTNDAMLARRLAMARNHAEAVHKDNGRAFPAWESCVGLNLRMTEIQAAILIPELQNFDEYVHARRQIVTELSTVLPEYGYFVRWPKNDHLAHVWYVCPIVVPECQEKNTAEIVKALQAELMPDEVRIDRGVPIGCGYIDPLYLMPLFQERQHWAFDLQENAGHSGVYAEGTCPVAERLTKNGLIITLLHGLALKSADVADVVAAFRKVLAEYPGVSFGEKI